MVIDRQLYLGEFCMTGFAPKYFLFMFGLLFIAYYPIAIGMAIYVGGLYWFFSKENPLYGCIWAGGGCYISAFIVHNLIQLITQKISCEKYFFWSADLSRNKYGIWTRNKN